MKFLFIFFALLTSVGAIGIILMESIDKPMKLWDYISALLFFGGFGSMIYLLLSA